MLKSWHFFNNTNVLIYNPGENGLGEQGFCASNEVKTEDIVSSPLPLQQCGLISQCLEYVATLYAEN